MSEKNGRLHIPLDIMNDFEPWMLDIMSEAALAGGTRNQIILATGLPKRRFNAFLTKGGPDYNEDFSDAFERATLISCAFWERIGRDASMGKIPRHSASTYRLMLTNNFRADYKDEQTIKHEGKEVPTISKDLTPVEASQAYKQLLLESSCGDLFDD